MSKPALFLDRDGVIVREVEGAAAQHPDDLALMPGIIPVLRRARELGYLLVVASNQPDVALGKISPARRAEIEAQFLRLAADEGITFDAVCYCYHHPSAIIPELRMDCRCKKPGTGMLVDTAVSMGIDLPQSIFVGDRASDIRAGHDAGTKTVLYDPNGKQEKYLVEHRVTPDTILVSLEAMTPLLEGLSK